MTPSRPRLQYLLPKFNTMTSCPSHIYHQLISPFVSNHHYTLPNSSSFICGIVLLPNDDVLPTADASTESFEETSYRMVFFCQIRLTCQSLPCTNFGVNICPFNYGLKGDFIPELTINTQRPQAKSVQHPFFPPLNRWSLRLDPNPSSSHLQASTLKWRTKTKLSR
jgi:hypothetical protein